MTKDIELWNPKFKKGEHFSMIVTASRNSGKSYLMRHLVKEYMTDKYDMFVSVCTSVGQQNEMKDVLPEEKSKFYSKYTPRIISLIYGMNRRRLRDGKRALNVLFMLDDTVGNKLKYDDALLQAYCNGRHNGISIIFLSQSLSLCSSQWRTNSDYFIMLKHNSPQTRKSIRENILSGAIDIDDDESENKVLTSIQREYSSEPGDALVMSFTDSSTNNLFRYRAP